MRIRLFAALLLVASSTALAQDPTPCADDQTFTECFERVRGEAAGGDVGMVAEKQEDAVEQELKTALTGADSGGAATASTMNDLAQLLNALGLLSSGDTEGSKIAVDLNFLLPVQEGLKDNNAQLRGIINTEPEPLDQLVQAFDETVRAARKDSLQKDIAALGDAQISFTWSLVNSRFGRDYSVLRRNIALMNQGAVSRGRSAAGPDRAALIAVPQLIRRVNVAVQAANPQAEAIATTAKFSELPSELREEFKKATFEAAKERAAITTAIQAELTSASLNRLAELVEQQPQLLFSLTHDFRDEIVGPETTSATVTWEFNGRNLGAFLRNEGEDCMKADVALGTSVYDACVSALRTYVGDGVQKQWRGKIEASYKRVDSVSYSFADDNVNLTLPKHDRWEVAVGAGRALSNDKNGGRIDLELSYDSNLDNDDSNKERVTASLTYTRRVGDMDMPFSIVYANKDEFLGEVDHQISMNVGLKFRQPKN